MPPGKTNVPRSPIEADHAADSLRDRILGAAFGAFMEIGYGKTSMLEIATRARISKRDLYACFPDKRSILTHAIGARARKMRLPLDLPAPDSAPTLERALLQFGAATLREGSRPTTIAVFRLAIGEPGPEVANVLNTVAREANRAALARFFAKARRQGLLAPAAPRLMAEQFQALLWGGLLMELLLGASEPPDEAAILRRAREATRAFLLIHGAKT